MSGYIKLWRSVQNDSLWDEKPFDKARAWIDMILLANWKPSHFFVRGIRVDVQRGQMAYSVDHLSDRWGWSRNKVKRFLAYLQTEGQIDRQSNNVTTLISLTNYEKYQENGQANEPANEQSGELPDEPPNEPADEPHKKKVKKGKKVNRGTFTPPTVDEVRQYCEERGNNIDPNRFVDHYQSKGWLVGKTKMSDWKAAVRTWERNSDEPKKERYGEGGI